MSDDGVNKPVAPVVIKVDFANGGFLLSYDGTLGRVASFVVTGSKNEITIKATTVEVGDEYFQEDGQPTVPSPVLQQAFKKGADYALALLKAAGENAFATEQEVKDFLLSKQTDIQNHMSQELAQAQSGDIVTFYQINEKQELQEMIDKFEDQRGLGATIKVLEPKMFDELVKQYDKGLRLPAKDVEVLITKDASGKLKHHLVYREGLFVAATSKTLKNRDGSPVTNPDGSPVTIQLDPPPMGLIFTMRDKGIKTAVDNPDLPIDKDGSGNKVEADPNKPYLNLFAKAMWVVKVTKTILSEAEIIEKRWNTSLNQNDWPWDVHEAAAGPANALIDEAKSWPDMFVFAMSMLSTEERQAVIDAFKNMTLSDIMGMLKSTIDQYDPAENTTEEITYAGTHDVTAGAFVLLTGGKDLIEQLKNLAQALKKLKKIDWSKINLPDVKSKKLANDISSSPELTEAIAKNPDLVEAWNALDNIGVEDVIRKNPDYLKNIDDYAKRSGKNADEVADLAKNNENGIEQFLDELEDTPSSGHWDKNPFQRGKDIEDDLGQNLPETFKTIDKYDDLTGEATSIKSLDLDAKTYQDASKLRGRLNKYVDQLDEFAGHRQEGFAIGNVPGGQPINSKSLELALPRAATGDQLSIINEVIANATNRGIQIKVIVIP